MKRALLIALLVCGMAALKAYAADPGRQGHSERHGARMQGSPGWGRHDGGDRMADLNLSQSQKDRIAKVRESHQKDMIQARADLQLARLEFRKLMRADNPDQRAIHAEIDRMTSIRADMMKSRVDQRLEVRDILTSDQRAKLREGRGSRSDTDDEAPGRELDSRRP